MAAAPQPGRVQLTGFLTKSGGEDGAKSKKRRLVAVGTAKGTETTHMWYYDAQKETDANAKTLKGTLQLTSQSTVAKVSEAKVRFHYCTPRRSG